MNHLDRLNLSEKLCKAGFDVTVIPFAEMTKEGLNEWLEKCREVFRERNVS